jgi:uncharacterized membrane protein
MRYLSHYAIALPIFLAIDALWLGVIARSFYAERMGDLMADQPRWLVAAIFYMVYVVGVVHFAILPGVEQRSWQTAAWTGALFGFFCYLTYDATNLAVLKGYDPVIAIVDTIWGTVLTATTAGATAALALKFFSRS